MYSQTIHNVFVKQLFESETTAGSSLINTCYREKFNFRYRAYWLDLILQLLSLQEWWLALILRICHPHFGGAFLNQRPGKYCSILSNRLLTAVQLKTISHTVTFLKSDRFPRYPMPNELWRPHYHGDFNNKAHETMADGPEQVFQCFAFLFANSWPRRRFLLKTFFFPFLYLAVPFASGIPPFSFLF